MNLLFGEFFTDEDDDLFTDLDEFSTALGSLIPYEVINLGGLYGGHFVY